MQKLACWIKSFDFSLIRLQLYFEPLFLHDYLPYDSLEVGKDLIDVIVTIIQVLNVGFGVLDEQALESVNIFQKSQLRRSIFRLHSAIGGKLSLLPCCIDPEVFPCKIRTAEHLGKE